MAEDLSVVVWRNQYDPAENDVVSDDTALECPPHEDKAVQDQKEDADINVLVQRFGLTGHMPEAQAIPFWGDFSEVGTFQEALQQLQEAEDHFNALPATVRARFQNNPAELIDFVRNDQNREEAISIGLLPKPAVEVKPEPTRVIVVTDPTAPAAPK